MDILTEIPASRPLPPAARAAQRQLLEEWITTKHASRRWAPRTLAAGIAAVVLLSGGAATAYVAFAPATDRSKVRCYSEASIGSDTDYHGTEAGVPSSAGGVDDPIALCAAIWRAGIIRVGSYHADGPASEPQPVPPLVACALQNGVAAVFPGDAQTCRRLGLPALAQ